MTLHINHTIYTYCHSNYAAYSSIAYRFLTNIHQIHTAHVTINVPGLQKTLKVQLLQNKISYRCLSSCFCSVNAIYCEEKIQCIG